MMSEITPSTIANNTCFSLCMLSHVSSSYAFVRFSPSPDKTVIRQQWLADSTVERRLRRYDATISNHKNYCFHLCYCSLLQLCVGAGTVVALSRYRRSPEYMVALWYCGDWRWLSGASHLHSGLAGVPRSVLVRETRLARLSLGIRRGFGRQQHHRARGCACFQSMDLHP